MPDLYEVEVNSAPMLGMCNWYKNGKRINGIYVPAEVLHRVARRLDEEKNKPIKP